LFSKRLAFFGDQRNETQMKILRETKSVCPHCLMMIPAAIYEKEGEVYMQKACPEHGGFDVYMWPDADHYRWFSKFDFPAVARSPQAKIADGCPRDCGLCGAHRRRITLPEIEVTWRCNLSCPVCFMFDGGIPEDPSIEEIVRMLDTIRNFDGQGLPIQITGGEPTVRNDLPEIIATAGRLGFTAVELNTNGLVIGRDIGYLRLLKKSGVTNIYLQFDGVKPETTLALRGRNVLADKLQAIENCKKEAIPVILSVTIVKGINENELGELIRFAMHHLNVIHGLALQPAFVSGRFEVEKPKHLSVGDVARLISAQTNGKISPRDFWPVGSSHPLCYGSTYLLGTGDQYKPFTRDLNEKDYLRMLSADSPQGAVFMDIVGKSFPEGQLPVGLPILIMEYMDAWTLDLDRASGCNLAVTVADGNTIPFCIYHLMDINGRRLYPHGGGRPDASGP
jgi:7,8-dihydro-6-hydroxymethylpterin dimethyltransferase